MLSMVRGPNLLVANGATDSAAFLLDQVFGDSLYLTVLSPDTLPETASIQISVDFDTAYKQNGLTLAAATTAAHWDAAPAGAALGAAGAPATFATGLITAAAARIHLSGAAGGDRTFITYKQVENV